MSMLELNNIAKSYNYMIDNRNEKLEYTYVGGDDSDFSDSDFDIDLLKNKAWNLAKNNGEINILRSKELWYIAHIGNNVVGALFGDTIGMEFSIDVIVDRKYRRQGIATKLTDLAISDYHEQYEELGYKLGIDIVNPNMVHFLKRKYGIGESENTRIYAYHCTDTNPLDIMKNGFHSSDNGLTIENQFEFLYDNYLPSNPCFISKAPWSKTTKYIIKLDITGLELYPDFGSLPDYGAYYDEPDGNGDTLFWWETKYYTLNSGTPLNEVPKLKKYLSDHDGYLHSEYFTGDLSWELIGTACIDGDDISKDRIVSFDDISESSKKDWAAISNINKLRKMNTELIISPEDFSNSIGFDRIIKTNLRIVDGSDVFRKLYKFVHNTGVYQISPTIHVSDDNSHIIFDMQMYSDTDWDEKALNDMISGISKNANWMKLSSRILDQKIIFLRYSIYDSIVKNKVFKLRNLDNLRTDYKQMELF